MAEGPALEKRYPGHGIVGSNPTLSATAASRESGDASARSAPAFVGCPAAAGLCLVCHGEMSELAEGARLEIVCAVKSGTEGSNPSLSARFFRPGDIGSIAAPLSLG